MTYVFCKKCGNEEPDQGPGVECPKCGHGPMPTKKPARAAPIPYANKTKYGFQDGPAEVQRICTETDGSVVIAIITARQRLEVRVTPSGLIRFGLVPKQKE